jgi:hypothetical protein
MFLGKDSSYSSKTISHSRKHQRNIAAALLWDIVGTCKLGTLSVTKVADNIIVYGHRKGSYTAMDYYLVPFVQTTKYAYFGVTSDNVTV